MLSAVAGLSEDVLPWALAALAIAGGIVGGLTVVLVIWTHDRVGTRRRRRGRSRHDRRATGLR